MTVRSFWNIVIKIIGLFLVLDFVQVAFQLFSTYGFYWISRENYNVEVILIVVVVLVLYLLALRVLFFKTNWIISKLKLDQGFLEDKFEFNIHRSVVLKISIIIVGAILLIESIPQLVQEIKLYLQIQDFNEVSKNWIAFYFVKFMIGYFLLTTSNRLTNFIELKRRQN